MTTPAKPTTTVKAAAGGSFLIEERTPQEVFTPEDFNDEQRQIAETASRYAASRGGALPATFRPASTAAHAPLISKLGSPSMLIYGPCDIAMPQ